ncbi:MAG: hypothetical protein EZS28_007815 [Streblomastix strix]|uniref:DNA repair protein RAD51 homolog 3 n=1 Tax=Streblomastix strix TaxID=222440 RepID=A0A5J4WRG3_9EUKA|nr:MAG: hypothetical protein EZS28_007815 [Streblomastix strix]
MDVSNYHVEALELLKQQNHFPTKIKQFDQALSGGLPCRSLCEISGDKRAGKTLFCLQLALNCSLSKIDGGLEEGTLVISTDSSFSVRKLLDMGKNYFESNKEIDQNSTPKQNIETSKVEKESKTNSDAKLAQLLERVHIILQLHTLNEMCDWMKKEMESLLITKGNIRLVIIDSVDQAASLSSTSSSSSSSLKPISTLQRQLMLSELIQQLKRLAEMFNLVVNTEIIAAMREEDRYDFDMDESGPEAEEDWT